MSSTVRIEYGVKSLAFLVVCASTYWLSKVFFPWDFYGIDSFSLFGFVLFVHIWGGFPSLFGLYYGLRTLFKIEASRVKGLVASSCFGLTLYFYALYAGIKSVVFPFLLQSTFESFVLLMMAIFFMGSYLVISRYFLRALQYPCPSIRQSLPAWSILLIALLFISSAAHIFLGICDVLELSNDVIAMLFYVLIIVIYIAVYKTGKWLFVRQKVKNELTLSTESKQETPIER